MAVTLQSYNVSIHNRNLEALVEGLGDVLTDSNKMVLFHYICQLLPGEAQNEFDRIAAAKVSGGIHIDRVLYACYSYIYQYNLKQYSWTI